MIRRAVGGASVDGRNRRRRRLAELLAAILKRHESSEFMIPCVLPDWLEGSQCGRRKTEAATTVAGCATRATWWMPGSALIEPLLPPAKRGGNKSTVNRRVGDDAFGEMMDRDGLLTG
jgi:hypothetical protein